MLVYSKHWSKYVYEVQNLMSHVSPEFTDPLCYAGSRSMMILLLIQDSKSYKT